MNSIGTVTMTRPAMSVARNAKICTPVGITTAWDAAENRASDTFGRPVVYMWWTQRPNEMKPVPTADRTIQE